MSTQESTESSTGALGGLQRATVRGEDESGMPLLDWPGSGDVCSATCVWMETLPSWSGCVGLSVLIGFENGNSQRPIIVGLLGRPERVQPKPASKLASTLEMESSEEMVLRCGKAKIALRADGRIEIRGGYLLSRSTGSHRIQGASVHIN